MTAPKSVSRWAIVAAAVAALLSGCGGGAPGSTGAPAGGTDNIVVPHAPTDQVTAPTDRSLSRAPATRVV
jgi:ABC-type glycerol-3-phosphate transport system substrate-binding protein